MQIEINPDKLKALLTKIQSGAAITDQELADSKYSKPTNESRKRKAK